MKLTIEHLDEFGRHAFLPVKINGKRYRFLLDTGASHTVLDRKFFEKNFGKRKIKKSSSTTTGIHSSGIEASYATLPALQIDRLTLLKTIVGVMCLENINSVYRGLGLKKVYGIIGCDVMITGNAVVDFAHQKITLRHAV